VHETPDDQAQRTCTAPALPILRTTHKGWAYGGNAPASVDATGPLIVACAVPNASHDTQQAEPRAQATLSILAQAGMERPPDASGPAQASPATLDHGSASAAAVEALETVGVEPYIATERQRHQGPQTEAPETPATVQERLAATVRTPAGKAVYARRQVIVAPVFGQSKEARGLRRFLRRGLDAIRGEWRLLCLTHNLLKMWRYGSAQSAASCRRESPQGACKAPVQGVVLMRNCPVRSQGEVKEGGYWDTGPINRVKEPLVLILGQAPRACRMGR
jgi:Transposase DDE domain